MMLRGNKPENEALVLGELVVMSALKPLMMTRMLTQVAVLSVMTLPLTINGQPCLGVSGGLSTGSIRVDDIHNRGITSIEGNYITGFEAGIHVKFPACPVYVRPQVLYSRATGSVTFHGTDGTKGTTDFNISKVRVPVTIGFGIAGPLGIEASVMYDYVIGATETYGSSSVRLGRSGFGYRIGPAIDLGDMLLHVSYEGAAYMPSPGRVSFREPYRFVFGISTCILGG